MRDRPVADAMGVAQGALHCHEIPWRCSFPSNRGVSIRVRGPCHSGLVQLEACACAAACGNDSRVTCLSVGGRVWLCAPQGPRRGTRRQAARALGGLGGRGARLRAHGHGHRRPLGGGGRRPGARAQGAASPSSCGLPDTHVTGVTVPLPGPGMVRTDKNGKQPRPRTRPTQKGRGHHVGPDNA